MFSDKFDVLSNYCSTHCTRFVRTKHPLVIAPMIPLTFVVGYQADLAWGNKMERVIGRYSLALYPGCKRRGESAFFPPSCGLGTRLSTIVVNYPFN